jgi:hypothetical protein
VPAFTVRYSFLQHFRVAARVAYAWCTDYRSNDHSLMGEKGQRKISKLSQDALILTDTWLRPGGRSVTKVKLVRLDPKQLSWTSTHIAGPARYSQFLYRIIPEGRGGSRLEFSGAQHERARNRPTRARMNLLARRLQRDDALAWKHIARAMEDESEH